MEERQRNISLHVKHLHVFPRKLGADADSQNNDGTLNWWRHLARGLVVYVAGFL
jgi:hypothetical protein